MTRLGPSAHAGFGGDCVFYLQQHVVRGVSEGTLFENEARDYLRVIEMEDAAYRSAEAGRWVEI